MSDAVTRARVSERELLVGVKIIDDQHQEVFHRVDALIDALQKGAGKAEVERSLSFLGAFVLEHFATEDQLMDQHRYPNAAAHKRQHADFVKTFERIRADFDRAGPSSHILGIVNKIVCGWLRAHVAGPDTALGKFIASSGTRVAM